MLSLCNGYDMACPTDPDSVIRAVADVAMREVWVGPPNAVTGMRAVALTQALSSGAGLGEALRQSGLSLIDVTLAPQILIELGMVLDAVHKHTALGNPAPPEQLVAVAVLAALPNLAKEGVTWPWLLNALGGVRSRMGEGPVADWFDVALEVFGAVHASERLIWELEHMGVIPHVVTGTEARQAWAHQAVSALTSEATRLGGLDGAAAANPGLVAAAAQAGDFGPRHMSYYKRGYTDIPGGYKVGPQTGYDYARDWMSSVVEGVVAGS